MSRPVRIREHLAAEVERLAKEEKRSMANMVEILLEQALKLQDAPSTHEFVVPGGIAQTSSTHRLDRQRDEVRTDFK